MMPHTKSNISQENNAATWLDPFLPALREAGTRVLELGCGPGEDAGILSVSGFYVAGCDLSQPIVEAAQINVPGASFFVADLRAPLPVRADAVDVVLASLSLHYFAWEPTRAAIREVHRTLRPDGAFLFRVNATDDVNSGARQGEEIEPGFYHVPPGRHDRPYKRFFDAEMVRAMLTPGWRIAQLAHRTIYRYGMPKQVWECLAYPLAA